MNMIISIVSIVAFAGMALCMFVKARFMVTRRVAGVAVAMCVAEVVLIGLLSGVTNPAVMGLLLAARVTVLACCALALRHDAEMVKARARRRNRFTVDMINVEYPLRVVRHQQNTAQINVVA